MTIKDILTPTRWPLLAVLISAAMLAAAHGFEYFGDMHPCALCLRQRDIYWAAIAIGLVGSVLVFFGQKSGPLRGIIALLGLSFLTGALVAGYHAGVEWHFWPGPASCTGDLSGIGALSPDELSAALSAPTKAPACDQIPWSLLGISMAGWNALISLALAMASFYTLRTEQK